MSEPLPREVSVETRPCANCGKPLAVVQNGDGSTSTMACEDCFPATEKAAATPALPREKGTEPKDDDA